VTNGKIALYINEPSCAYDSVNGVITALSPKYEFKFFSKLEPHDTFFDDVDIICFPGGIGDSDRFDTILGRYSNRIRDLIKGGKKYLGICMGAYWADMDYFNILDGTRVEQYIRRPNADTRRPHAKGQLVDWQGQLERMYFYDGACMVGGNVDCVARYSNGDPMAIIQGNVGIIGCHPESEQYWYDYHSWMPKQWHHGRHHKLLLNFVDRLVEGK
jgi:glutamine amidotransferase-like uncharacterized protein